MRVKLSKFGRVLISRPAGREAFKSYFAYLSKEARAKHAASALEIDFGGLVSLAPSWLDEFVQHAKEAGWRIVFGKSRNDSVIQTLKTLKDLEAPAKIHPWRICPAGQHWVREHPRQIRSEPGVTSVDGHCRANPSRKDSFYPEEIARISRDFPALVASKAIPAPPRDGGRYARGDDFDDLIAGWAQYWNDVLKPADRLDSALVKALIASESGFRVKTRGRAIGLMQLMPETVDILNDPKGELRDHLVHLTRKGALEPSANVCAGIRWLIHKKDRATAKLRRPATWEEAVAEYKSVRRDKRANPKRYARVMGPFLEYWQSHQAPSAGR